MSPSGNSGSVDTQNDGSGVASDEIVITGVRASLSSAQSIKRNADQIVDSIVAEDIGKLPDRNVAEALQRITGVQVQRSYGEGSSIAIHGLSQVRTEINGRDIFTASGGRSLSLEDVPSELLAGVDVYKNPSADLIEGGIGGLINLRTRKPFDFDSKAPSPGARDTSGNQLFVPLEQLSKYSYNLVGFYDRGPLSARVAYNWRSKYVVTTAGNGSGNLPIFNAERGQLDASVTYTVSPNFALTVDGINLTNTENRTYYGIESRPQSYVLNDRRVSITARITY